MHLVAGFESSTYVEMAIEQIREECNITADDIAFVEMKAEQRPQTFFDTIHSSDGSSSVDGMAVGGVVVGVLGIIYGSRMWLGSVVIGVLGFIVGSLLGYLIDKWIGKRKRMKPIRHIEILLLIRCQSKEILSKVADICRANNVVSLGVHP